MSYRSRSSVSSSGSEKSNEEDHDVNSEPDKKSEDDVDSQKAISEESEENYSDEEDDEEQYRIKKKPKKLVNDFIIQEAEVDEDVEEDEDWEEGAQEIGIVENEIDEIGPTAREIEGHRRVSDIWNSQKEEEIEAYLRNKYANAATASHHFGEGGEEMSDEITQKTLLPDVKDPNLWLVKCRIGEENATLLLLIRKFLTYQFTDNPLVIKCAIVPNGVKGFVYIEAYKQVHVKAAIENINSLKQGIWRQQMVPISEMVDVLRVRNRINLKSGQWVRIKRGMYKDDIAQVDYVDVGQNKVHLKLLPRIDYARLRGALKPVIDDEAPKRKKKNSKPPAKHFDAEAVRAIGGEVTSNGDYLVFEGNHYSHKGFLYKNFNISGIISDGVKPTLSEIESFEENPESIDIELNDISVNEGISIKDSTVFHKFSPGDKVEVREGELMHLQGKIISIDGNNIMVQPSHKDLTDPIEFLPHELKKYFTIGDHVKVLEGKYEGDTGLIVRIEETRVVLFSDLSMHELEVLASNIQLCPDVATGVDSLGKFQWGDMVQLEVQIVGVIVRLERENFQVLSMHGKIVDAKPGSLLKYRENKNTTALDMHQNQIKRRDIVKVVDGPHSGREGEIRHLYRNFAFLHSKIYIDTGGIFVCKTRHLQLVGGEKLGTLMDVVSPVYASPVRSDKSSSHKNRGVFGPIRDKKLIGLTIRITGGPYKGSIGFVKDATESTVRVELHSPCQTISVDRSHILSVPQANAESTVSTLYTPTYSVSGRTPMYGSKEGSKTPMHGSQTPVHGSQTPMQGSQTPLYDVGSRTPGYYGSMTPSQDGSRTPGISGAWDPTVSNTPARCSEYDEPGEEDEMATYSPVYQDSQSSNPSYDTEKKFPAHPSSPSSSPALSPPSSPAPHCAIITPPPSDNGIESPPLEYTPSSPTESDRSMISEEIKPSYYGSPASPDNES
ncbi:transcription elongation factor SPT5-like [Phymastichus coffea]|uniref:transcription elongation factor SPT5-like n=1 Tax=Phymastichus coffea TaxID=108790 RepID=UPI00273BC1ED|nr:transcription elongation factor SPT5-like [Phymastichus coffea]